MTNLDKVATNHICKFKERGCNNAEKTRSKRKQSYRVYKKIVMLHICNKFLGIRLTGYPANRNKRLALIKF